MSSFSLSLACKRQVHLDFEGNSALEGTSRTGVDSINFPKIVKGAAEFKSNEKITLWQYSNQHLETEFAATFRFKPYRFKMSKYQVLLSNCDENNKDAAIEIKLDTSLSEITFRISTTKNPDNRITLNYTVCQSELILPQNYDNSYHFDCCTIFDINITN